MKIRIIPLISLMLWLGITLPGRSQQISPENPPTVAQNNPQQTELTKAEILNACIQERSENLPQLYSDVPANPKGHLKPCKQWLIVGRIVLPHPPI